MSVRVALIESICREVRTVLRSPWDIAMFIVMPVIWCLLIAGLFGQGMIRDVPVGVVNLDHQPESIELEAKLDALPSVKLVSYDSPLEAQKALKRSDIYAYLTIPDRWLDRSGKPDASSLELYFPKSLYAIATTLELDIKQALLAFQKENLVKLAQTAGLNEKQAKRATELIGVHSITLGNIAFNFQAYILPTLIPGILHLGLALALASRLLAEWHDKKVKLWLDVAKGSPLIAFLGKAIPWWILYTFYGFIYIAVMTGYLGWWVQGSLLLWLIGLAFFMAVMTLLPLFLIGVFMPLGWVIVLSCTVGYIAPIFPYTGFSYPLDSMAEPVQWLAMTFPLTHYFHFQGQEWILNAPLTSSLYTLGKLAIFALLWFGVGFALFKKRIAQEVAGENEVRS
ncbi:ABC transporter permease [Parasutterella secunda]|uniref:ABC transporter permease n=1 Tax=Parasutterella secunda TaxID=626947 RepID=UPI0025A428C4|nr:ABC transporter permease [Parasutterella secunda]MDM8086889.1 ABC transporter permease [Parasutterella secunda]MDM8226494.1 ABC transporter permease [Parasutterella secunda]